MAHTIKAILPDTEVSVYKNVKDAPEVSLTAVNINICNVTAGSVNVFLSFTPKGGDPTYGMILSAYPIPANSFLTVSDRILNVDNEIKAYASTANSLVLSLEILEDRGETIYPLA